MTIGVASQTYNFTSQFSNSELLFDSFERVGKAPSELSQQMLTSARRSLNLLLQSLANVGPMLWAVPEEPYTVLLQQGVSSITLPSYISSVLDVYVRQYVNLQTINLSVNVTTTASQSTVDIYQPAHGLLVGQSIYIVTPISVGGLILQGYYLVFNVPDQNDFQIQAQSLATSTVVNGGVVPEFTTASSSAYVTVTLPNHGYSVGSGFNVPIATTIAGITLQGSYQVTSVTNANVFVINAAQVAPSSASAYLNGGQAQINEQTSDSVPTDRILTPMSRTDYNSLPYKQQQGFPYTFWTTRVNPPTMTFWEVPDQNGPYILNVYYLRQLQDANLGMGEIPDLQYRALEAVTAKLACKLAVKFAPDKYQLLKAEADEEWAAFEEENREKVPLFIQPEMQRFYRG